VDAVSKLNVGDRVIILRSRHADLVGTATTVTSWLHLVQWSDGLIGRGHDVDIVREGLILCFPPEFLERVPDDGHLAGEWTDELRKLCEPKVNA
jgi:hypothetical protein